MKQINDNGNLLYVSNDLYEKVITDYQAMIEELEELRRKIKEYETPKSHSEEIKTRIRKKRETKRQLKSER